MTSNNYFNRIASKYKKGGILIDTNLLVLLIIGECSTTLISTFKRTRKYTIDDFNLMKRICAYFDHVICTPNVLTETSNLLGQLPQNILSSAYQELEKKIKIIDEKYVPSIQASSSPAFEKMGLTDGTLYELTQGPYLLLTDDFPLVNFLHSRGIDAININHIRTPSLIG